MITQSQGTISLCNIFIQNQLTEMTLNCFSNNIEGHVVIASLVGGAENGHRFARIHLKLKSHTTEIVPLSTLFSRFVSSVHQLITIRAQAHILNLRVLTCVLG